MEIGDRVRYDGFLSGAVEGRITRLYTRHHTRFYTRKTGGSGIARAYVLMDDGRVFTADIAALLPITEIKRDDPRREAYLAGIPDGEPF